MSDFNKRFLESIKLKESREETLSKSISFLQQKQLFDPLIEAIRNTSMSWFSSIYQEELDMQLDENFHQGLLNHQLRSYFLPI